MMVLISVIGVQSCVNPGSPLSNEVTITPVIPTVFTAAPTSQPIKTLIPSITPTNTPTNVPIGIFPLKFYPPLVMNYDPTLWEDKSEYKNQDWMINYLQARNFVKCIIGVQGPTDFNGPTEFTDIQLGNIRFSMMTFENTERAEVGAMYIEQQTLIGYDYAPGLPIPTINSSLAEWEDCRTQAEEVLATLQSPMN